MKKIASLLLSASTTVLAVLSGQSSFAFTIINSQAPVPSRPYDYLGVEGETNLDAWPVTDPRRFGNRGNILEVRQGGTSALLDLLEEGWPDWTFTPVTDPAEGLEGSFEIKDYKTCIPSEVCFTDEEDGSLTDLVGAVLDLEYLPAGNDPTGDSVHWIQRINDNIDEGQVKDIIDNGGASVPYYDEFGEATSTTFFDAPSTPFYDEENFAYLELFLVEEIAPQEVKIYNGIRYGFENKVFSVDDPAVANETQEVNRIVIDDDSIQSSTSVPEPGTVLGIITFAILSTSSVTLRNLSGKRRVKLQSDL